MHYKNIVKGTFIKRINRFIAEVMIDNIPYLVHVKNTGRLKELLISGADVLLEKSTNPDRKTAYSLIAVYLKDKLINIDSQVPNQVVYEGIQKCLLEEIGSVSTIKKEVTFQKSRFDIYFEAPCEKGFIEVKGVTLIKGAIALFPDAPTLRGIKHINELIDAVKKGYSGYILFLIQTKGVSAFSPNTDLDTLFAETLARAAKSGVNILAYDSIVTEDAIVLGDRIPVKLPIHP